MAQANMKSRKRSNKTNSAGRELLEGVRQMQSAVTSGDFTGFQVNEIQVPDPSEYQPEDVRELRDSLGLTQATFARVMGASKETVEHWEQGVRHPGASARRLMDQIRGKPEAFLSWLTRNRSSIVAGSRGKNRGDAAKTRARAMLKAAARVLTEREMVDAVHEAFRT